MANMFEKGLGMGSSGASAGMAIGGPVGAVIGGGLGFLGGLFSGGDSDVPYAPPPEALKSYNFSDIDLKSMNPEMYEQLIKNDAILKDMGQAVQQRNQSLNANENRQISDYMNKQASGMASNGMEGTPMGNAMMADAHARLLDQARQRAFQEYTGLQGQYAQQANNNAGLHQNAQNAVLGQLNQNRNTAYDQYMRQYQDAQQRLGASNQFYGGLMNGGLNYLGQQQNRDLYAKAMGVAPPQNLVNTVGSWF